MSTERIDIYGGKATIKQNKFGVWQFRMWVSNEKRYYEKSLRTKRRAEAIDKAEEMYFDLQNELKDGRKLFSVSIADAVAIYLEHRKIDVRTKEIVEGRWVTIRAHEPPHLNWSSAMFRKRRTDNDEQTTEAGRDYHEVEAS